MTRRIDDEDDETEEITFPDTDDEGDDDDDDDYDVAEYIGDMVDFDYRHNPPPHITLSEEDNRLVNEDLKLLKQKGIYPYEYMDSFERFKEPTLPKIEAFNSTLKGEGISKKDYARANNIFVHFQMQTLQDYHNFYLLQDILLLNDVLLAFRDVC